VGKNTIPDQPCNPTKENACCDERCMAAHICRLFCFGLHPFFCPPNALVRRIMVGPAVFGNLQETYKEKKKRSKRISIFEADFS
jgi:hypothetical protein